MYSMCSFGIPYCNVVSSFVYLYCLPILYMMCIGDHIFHWISGGIWLGTWHLTSSALPTATDHIIRPTLVHCSSSEICFANVLYVQFWNPYCNVVNSGVYLYCLLLLHMMCTSDSIAYSFFFNFSWMSWWLARNLANNIQSYSALAPCLSMRNCFAGVCCVQFQNSPVLFLVLCSFRIMYLCKLL